MAFWCIDPANGSDSTGASNATQSVAETTPYKTHAAVIADTPLNGDSILFKGGEFELGTQSVSIDGTVYGSYGDGLGGIDANGERSALLIASATVQNLSVSNMDLKGGKHDGSNAITVRITGDKTTVNNISLSSCHIHDAEHSEDGGDGHGFDITAAGVSLADCEVNGFPDDGIYSEANNTLVEYCTVYDVDRSISLKSGDCCKFSGAAACTDSRVHHSILDHSTRNRKSAAIIAGTGAGQICEHNKCTGGASTIFCSAPSAVLRRNLIHPHKPGFYGDSTDEITRTDGIVIEDVGNVIVESNIIDSQVLFTPNNHIFGVATMLDNLTVQGNIAYGPLQASGVSVRIQGSSSGHIIRNNIIGGGSMDGATGTFHINMQTNVTLSECDHNIYTEDGNFSYGGVIYLSLAEWQAGTGFDTNSIIVDAATLFRDAENGDFRVNEGRHVLGAMADYKDFLGVRNYPPVIGAYVQNEDTTRSQDSTRLQDITRLQDSTRSTRDILYPAWGVRT